MDPIWLDPVLTNWLGYGLQIGVCEESAWSFKFVKGEEESPVCKVSEDDLGISGIWDLMVPEAGGGSVPVVRGRLAELLAAAGCNPQLALAFPFIEIAKTALRERIKGPPGLHESYPTGQLGGHAVYGLHWIADLGPGAIDPELAQFITLRLADKKLNQAVRHRLLPVVTAWENENGLCWLREPRKGLDRGALLTNAST